MENKKVLSSFFASIEEHVIAVGIIIMILMEAFNALTRHLIPVVGEIPEEIAVFAYIWVCFLCASFCVKKGSNIVVDMIAAKYPSNIKRVLKALQYILDILVYGAFLYGAFIFVADTMAGGARGLTGIPLWIIYLAPVVGFGLCIIRNIQLLMGMKYASSEVKKS